MPVSSLMARTYNKWAFTMKEHLASCNMLDLVIKKAGEEIEEGKIDINPLQKAQQVKSMLLSVISPNEIAKVTHCKTAPEIWKYFKQAYGSKNIGSQRSSHAGSIEFTRY